MLLSISNLTKYFGAELILSDISFVVNANERVGLVGANGVGKSTLLKIITGQLQADSGAIAINPKASVGYLPQVISSFAGSYADKTLDELLLDLQGNLTQLTAQLRQLEAQMATASGDALAQLMQTYGDLSEEFEQAGGYELDHRVDEVFAGLEIAHLSRDRAVNTLSGGEKERVGLAALLLRSPDLLLLDEPTNHLDFAALAWLEAYLKSHAGGLLAVSHDRQFLNNTVSAILEIDEYTRGLKSYTGNYEDYLVARERSRVQWAIDYEAQQEEIKELRKQMRADSHYGDFWKGGGKAAGDKFAKGFFKGRAAVATSRRVHNAEERLARIEENPIPKPPDEIRISPEFNPAELEGKTPLRVAGLRKAFGSRVLFDEVTFDLKPTDRVVITGPNGCGKSTLLRIIAGELRADAGEVTIARAARVGYLDQEQTALTNSNFQTQNQTQTQTQTAFDWWREGLTGDEESLRAEFFRFFLLTYEDAQKPIAALSIGQRRKLQLLKLIAEKANLLLLDEPTNHISFDVMEKFETALREFNGPILAVSHDRWFIERFGGQVWEFNSGQLSGQ